MMSQDQKERLEKIQLGVYDDPLSVIFGWVKQGVINKREFGQLTAAYYETINQLGN